MTRLGRRALAIAALLAFAPEVRAQEPTLEVTVQPGETCRSLAARIYGDAEAYDRIHAHNPQMGPPPHRLSPGTVLRVPRPEPPARLSAVHRVVERRDPDDAAFAPARTGQPLPRGTQVRTHDASSAEITFRDRAEVTVRERTLVIVYGGRRRLVERAITRAELERGALRSRLGELAGRRPLEVETPSSHASLDGDAVVSVEDDGTSRVANHGERPATVVAGGARVVLPGGTGTVVRQGERPARPRRLLAAPRWRADHRGPVLGFVGRGASLRGGFDPVRGAARYRVEIARRPDGGELLGTLELGGDASRFEAEGLPEGTVYVSVSSIDEAGLEGRRSPWRAFTVRLARLVAPGGGEVELAEAPPRVLPGTWLVAPRGLSCAIGGGAPSTMITLRAPGRATLLCTDAAGTELAPLDVDVAPPHLVVTGVLVRDRASPLALSLSGRPLPSARVLAVRAPDGFRAGRVRGEAGALAAEVRAPPDAPSRAVIALEIVAGSERIALASVELPVRDPDGAASEPATEPSPVPERPAPVVTGALGDLAWPSTLSLRDEVRGGFGAWIYLAPMAAPSGDPQLRAGVGARAQLPGVPLRLAFASQLDALGRPSEVDRRGEADLLASAGVLVADEALASLALDASVWIPTRSEPESLGRVRLAPSLEGRVRPADWLVVRTRQGALIDAASQGARLWAFALGADMAPIEWLAVGLELDGSIGRFADRDGAALLLGGGVELRLEAFELALGARFALTDEARALMGEWSAIASMRVFSR